LPVLLQKRNQEVDRHLGVDVQLTFRQLDVANSNTQAENLLKLVLDGRSDFVGLGFQTVIVCNEGRELAGLVQTRTQETGYLLADRVGSKESGVLLGKLLDQLLVLV